MLNELIRELELFRGMILFTAIALAVFTVGSMTLVPSLGWKSNVLRIYGVLPGLKGGKMAALSLVVVRLLFFCSCILFSVSLKAPHFAFGVFLLAVLHLILADPEAMLYDIPCLAMIYGGLYVRGLLGDYLSGVRGNAAMVVMHVVLTVFILVVAVFEVVLCIRSISMQQKKGRIRIRPVNAARTAAIILAGAVVLLLPYYFINQVDTLIIQQEVYQYTDKGKTVHSGRNRVIKSGNGCVLEAGGAMIELDKTPLYYQNEDKILLTGVVSIIRPDLSMTNRIGNMSTISMQDDKYAVSNEYGNVKVSDFFLFDGKDTYVFFEPVTIEWNGNTARLSPFSYVSVKYNRTIRFYDKETGTYESINTGMCNAMVKMQCGARISLSTDILYREDGQEQMLFLQPNLLEDLK